MFGKMYNVIVEYIDFLYDGKIYLRDYTHDHSVHALLAISDHACLIMFN